MTSLTSTTPSSGSDWRLVLRSSSPENKSGFLPWDNPDNVMRACSMFLLLLVSAMLVTERQADGFLFDANKVEDTVRKAGKWVMDNCNLNKDGVTCNGVKLLRRRRSTQGLTDQSLTATLDKVCPEFNVGPKAKMADVVDTAMQEMDANKDGTLNTNESVRFTSLM
ncbi:hypothetical protein BaRGS_00035213, partial [Batillaria attramentaria]